MKRFRPFALVLTVLGFANIYSAQAGTCQEDFRDYFEDVNYWSRSTGILDKFFTRVLNGHGVAPIYVSDEKIAAFMLFAGQYGDSYTSVDEIVEVVNDINENVQFENIFEVKSFIDKALKSDERCLDLLAMANKSNGKQRKAGTRGARNAALDILEEIINSSEEAKTE